MLGCNIHDLEELDALELEAEEEGPSYLSDLNKVPDFVDEAPVEVPEVRHLVFLAKTSHIQPLQTPEQPEAVKTTAAA